MTKNKDLEYACMKIRCKDNNFIPYLYKKMKSTKHFENILLILINQDFKQNQGKNFKYLTSGDVMRAILRDNEGGKNANNVLLMKKFYKDNDLMKQLIYVSKDLKIHNLVKQIKDIKKNYISFFTKIQKGDTKAKPPKPCKLSKISNATIFTDGYKSFTYKTKKKAHKGKRIGINLDHKMRYIYMPHHYIESVIGNMSNILNININYSNGNFYFLINYSKSKTETKEVLPQKWAGIDPGVNNLLSIFIDDEKSKSLILDGSKYIEYNAKSNRFIAKINNEIDFNRNLKSEFKKGLSVDKEISYLIRYRKFLYEKRNNFFYSEFNKLSVRILEYLKQCQVTHIAIPVNLAYLKNNGKNNMNTENKQRFMQIPFMQLVRYIINKSHKYGITVKVVDESYTSKTSCLSRDIIQLKICIQNYPELMTILKNDSALSANVFKGIRAKRSRKESKGHRGMYFDNIKSIMINSDLNGAANICKLAKQDNLTNIKLFKLCNPIKLKCDGELLDLLNNNLRIEKVA